MTSATAPPLPKDTFYWLMEQSCATFGSNAAQMYKADGENYTSKSFNECYDDVKNLATALIKMGFKKGEKAGLIADVGRKWMWVSMAVTNIGGVDVPRGTDATLDDLKYILNHASCKFLFVEHKDAYKKIENELKHFKTIKHIIFFEKPGRIKPKRGIKIHTVAELMKEGQKEIKKNGEKAFHDRGKKVKEDDLLTLIYTSGTTGKPKGVMLTHQNFVFNINQLTHLVDMRPGDRSLGLLPPWHIAERLLEGLQIRAGACICFTSFKTLGDDLQLIKPTNFGSVPRIWVGFYDKIIDGISKAPAPIRGLLFGLFFVATRFSAHVDRLKGLDLRIKKEFIGITAIKKLISLLVVTVLFVPNLLASALMRKMNARIFGGEARSGGSGAGALPPHIDRFFRAMNMPIVDTYGMTELAGISTCRELNRLVLGTVGITAPDVEIKLIDEQGREVTEPGAKGVAHHKGKHVMKGYYRDPKRTKEVLKDGWFNSGDLLMWTANGDLKFAGRAKDTIVLQGGENLEPEPIENELIQSSFIDQVIIVGQDKKTLGALIVPDYEAVTKHFEEEDDLPNLKPKSDWNQTKEVKQLFKKEIKDRVSDAKGFKAFERVTDHRILMQPFEIGDELTQTMKMRRNVIAEKYKELIDQM